MKLYKDICSAWISRTSAEIFFSQIDVINVSKIKWIYYFAENTPTDFRGKNQLCCSIFLFLGISFLEKYGPKSQNYQFKLKFGAYTNSNMQNSIAVFTFFVFDQKCPFWINFVQKIKIISLSWNLVLTPIRICRIQWCCSLFLFLNGNTLFRQIWSKKSKLSI